MFKSQSSSRGEKESKLKEAKSMLIKSARQSQDLIAKAESIDKSQFIKYQGMFQGLKQTSRFALLYEFLLVARRLLLLYMAMFVREMAWLHVQLFMLMNVLFLAYLGFFKPFLSKLTNYWHVGRSWVRISLND